MIGWTLRRAGLWLLALGLVAGLFAAAVVLLTVERAPLVTRPPTATPAAAAATRDFVHRVRRLDRSGARVPELPVRLDEVQAVLDFGARLVPGARGQAMIEEGALVVAGSLALPLGRWLNVEATVAPFSGAATLSRLRLGGIDLPPALMTALGEGGLNMLLGRGLGTRVRDSVRGLEIADNRMLARLAHSREMRRSFTSRTLSVLAETELPAPERIEAQYLALRRAMDAGRLPDRGSFLPYVRFALETSLARAEPGALTQEFVAALFALTRACGARQFALVVGRMVDDAVFDAPRAWRRNCGELTLAGRIDTRRHFITAAAIKAASTADVSFAIGEFKELADSRGRGGVFDFTDVTANASGIRFADTMMAAAPADWPGLIARIGREGDVLAGFDGIPGKTPWPDFVARYGRMDSPAYLAMVERIERRIDALPLHAGRGRGGRSAVAEALGLTAPGTDAPRPPGE